MTPGKTTVKINICSGLLKTYFIKLREFPPIPSFLEKIYLFIWSRYLCLIKNDCWIVLNVFFASFEMICILSSINVMIILIYLPRHLYILGQILISRELRNYFAGIKNNMLCLTFVSWCMHERRLNFSVLSQGLIAPYNEPDGFFSYFSEAILWYYDNSKIIPLLRAEVTCKTNQARWPCLHVS